MPPAAAPWFEINSLLSPNFHISRPSFSYISARCCPIFMIEVSKWPQWHQLPGNIFWFTLNIGLLFPGQPNCKNSVGLQFHNSRLCTWSRQHSSCKLLSPLLKRKWKQNPKNPTGYGCFVPKTPKIPRFCPWEALFAFYLRQIPSKCDKSGIKITRLITLLWSVLVFSGNLQTLVSMATIIPPCTGIQIHSNREQ